MEALSLFRANRALSHRQYLSVCVCVWFIFLYIYCLQLPRLFVSERQSDFVVKDPLKPSCLVSYSCLYINNVCVCMQCSIMCGSVALNQMFLPVLQVYVPRRYAPGSSADSALGVWTLSVFVAEEERYPALPCRAVPCRPVPCCVWRHVPDWQTQSEEAAARPDLWR